MNSNRTIGVDVDVAQNFFLLIMPRLEVIFVRPDGFGTTLGGCWAIESAILDRAPIPSPAAPIWIPAQPRTRVHCHDCDARAFGSSAAAAHPPLLGGGVPSGTPVLYRRPV